MDEHEFYERFGGMDEELEEKLFLQAVQAMVRLFKAFRAGGLTTFEAALIIAAYIKIIQESVRGKVDGEN